MLEFIDSHIDFHCLWLCFVLIFVTLESIKDHFHQSEQFYLVDQQS